MPRTPAQAIATALSITTGFGGQCLQFSRTCYAIGPKYPSAYEAWLNAKIKHPTSNTKNIPKGAPIFFKSPNHNLGHVAIYLGGGKMRSSNTKANNRIYTVPVSTYVNKGYTLLGWTEDINGVEISGLKPPSLWSKARSKKVQDVFHVDDDGYFGDVSLKAGKAVRYASKYGGTKFPYGIPYLQRRIGAKVTGKWDTQARTAHDATIKALCVALGISARTTWDSSLEKAWQAFLAANYKTW